MLSRYGFIKEIVTIGLMAAGAYIGILLKGMMDRRSVEKPKTIGSIVSSCDT